VIPMSYIEQLGSFFLKKGKQGMAKDQFDTGKFIYRKNSLELENQAPEKKEKFQRRRSLYIKENFSLVMQYKKARNNMKGKQSISKGHTGQIGRIGPKLEKQAADYIQMFSKLLSKFLPNKLPPIMINMIDVVN
jgi:hypothetical protein